MHQNKIEINNECTEDSENEYVNKGAKKSPDRSDIEMLRERERAEQEDEIKMHKESLGKMRRAHERRQQRALKEQQRRDQRARTGRDNRERLSGQFVSNNIFAVLATTDFAGVSSSGAGSNSDSHSGSTEQKTVTSQNARDEQTEQSAMTEQDEQNEQSEQKIVCADSSASGQWRRSMFQFMFRFD